MANIEKLGSSSPEVLLKNATNLDKLVNGRESESLPDRFGVLRKTWHGMEMIFSRFIDYKPGFRRRRRFSLMEKKVQRCCTSSHSRNVGRNHLPLGLQLQT
ncbi:hypothetical protein EWQ15_08010 [Klebsiella pneumoniae]|nr:hypothetical protein EWQ15_08010 [Klebsiella pneumoniae]